MRLIDRLSDDVGVRVSLAPTTLLNHLCCLFGIISLHPAAKPDSNQGCTLTYFCH
jgi:hypothetical protein